MATTLIDDISINTEQTEAIRNASLSGDQSREILQGQGEASKGASEIGTEPSEKEGEIALTTAEQIEPGEGQGDIEQDRPSREDAEALEAEGETTSVHEQVIPLNEVASHDDEASIQENVEGARAPTPISRTSTPPLAGSVPVKKFSSVNVNRQFLKKTVGPASASPAGATKINSLTGRPAASPIALGSPSSRLLSSKLITVPSKTAASSAPPGSIPNSIASSPWAKPVVTATSLAENESPLAQPAPTRGRGLVGLTQPAPMGSGAGIGLGAAKPAWRAVGGDGRRPGGLSRDFPTAHEVAEGESETVRANISGKRQAQVAAQAQAAHNQAIIQGLNAFTQLDPNAHRWDDDEDDDDVIDFGDGMVYPSHDTTEPEPIPPPDIPVPKSERFAEDFDRSWPPKRPASPTALAPKSTPSLALPKRPDDKVLFNANLNKLEARTTLTRPPPPPQPTRVMTRPGPPLAGARSFERVPPPHLMEAAEEGDGRMLPPHMAGRPRMETRAPETKVAASSARQPWGAQRDDRPPHSERKELPPQAAAYTASTQPSTTNMPPRRSFSQAQPPAVQAPPITPSLPPSTVPDPQTQEMHTAAEKARLRRLAEETEREAAAERARRKAKEMEERLGLKVEPKVETLPAAQPTITLAQRPKPVEPDVSKPGPAGLPPRPAPETRSESLWRGKAEVQEATEYRSSRPTAESYFETSPVEVNIPDVAVRQAVEEEKVVRRDTNFEDTLKRIQAALKASKAAPADETPIESVPPAIVQLTSTSPSAPILKLPLVPNSVVVDYFEVSQIDPPKSPPPAWRTYTVKLPKPTDARPLASSLRHAPPAPIPRTFLMTFNPPLDGLPIVSRADLLLPQPIPLRRFTRNVDTTPLVSISPREFEPYKKQKRKSINVAEVKEEVPPLPLDILLPSPGIAASAQLRSQRESERWKIDTESISEPRKSRSPIKTSLAVKAERDGSFADGPVGLPERGRMPDVKPGVRFMVNSELEGDSLLDEINKMSLETVGEGYEEVGEEGEGEKSGVETPKTPPSLSGASSRGHPSSPISNSTPWSKGSARSSSQHDHIRSVWDQAGATVPVPSGTTTLQVETIPLYPSLNAPSPSDPPASIPSAPPFTQSQPFSPGSTASFGQSRLSPAHPGQYGYTHSPEHNLQQQNGMGYRSNGVANGIHGYGGLWGSGGFGSSMAVAGYGYSPQGQVAKEGKYTPGTPEYRYVGQASASAYGYQQQAVHTQATTGFPAQARPQAYTQAYYGGASVRGNVPQGRFGVGEYAQQNGYSGGEYYGGVTQQGAYAYGQQMAGGTGAIGQQRTAQTPGQARKMW